MFALQEGRIKAKVLNKEINLEIQRFLFRSAEKHWLTNFIRIKRKVSRTNLKCVTLARCTL